ncbi:MAG: phosphatase PAP2 family protein [bacterium]|nr:phosphatase PAP2 family protein [bacterium]
MLSRLARGPPFFRATEYVLFGFFGYTAVLSFVLAVSGTVTLVTTLLNAVVLGGLVFLAYADSLRRGEFLGIVRDWYVPPMLLLAYREVGWFAQPHTSRVLEESWVVWDKLLLEQWGLRAVVEAFGPVGPAVLEVSYLLVYAMPPIGLAVLYVLAMRTRVDAYLFNVTLGVLTVYVVLPYFPSEPPWTVFPGENFPTYDSAVRRLTGAILRGQGIHTGVFPSAHVAGSMSVAFALMRLLPEKRWIGWGALVLATLIAVATVYGRYHYAVDAVAGFGVAVVAAGVSAWREQRG